MQKKSLNTVIGKRASNPRFQINFSLDIVAENALQLSWKSEILIAQHNEIIALQSLIKHQLDAYVIETIASYHCLMIYFRHQMITSTEITEQIKHLAKHHQQPTQLTDNSLSVDCIKIPVYYDIEQQWDLAEVATRCNITSNEVIEQHSSTIYRGFALGFTPGFCYLASLPDTLHLPRKSSPRTQVPKGAVAIAEQQTAVYPNQSPGGWHIIGQTPLPMYNTCNGQFNATINVGQNVEFYAISKVEFIAMQQGLSA
ncbi:5-oxoprolinase subunit B family protein [Cognaticolwellia aestuarii]|uniref:5-oxoprolinase subunit B family protein n=1 Tax=Cognaticolwellia aestuarii TaxID=329993 RepID=UPI0009876C85|nr:allophanate hydrolase subunit 1 [Cognaticolwellia aestuarii]